MEESVRHFTVEGAGTTFVHPLGLAMLLLCGGLLVFLPRRYALWPFLVLVCFVSSRQCVAVLGVNLYFARIMALIFGTIRATLKGEWAGIRLTALDWAVFAYGVIYVLAGAMNWSFQLTELKTRCGYISEMLGIYILMRLLIRNIADIHGIILCASVITILVGVFFIFEFVTHRNLFAIFGGVSEITPVREGRLRCQGAFGHIIAGVFFASLVPLMVYGAIAIPRYRALIIGGIASAATIVILCASSTPLLGLVTVILGAAAYPYRRYSRHAFVGLAVVIMVLHFSMKAPVWSLIQRIDVTSGNSGYHRYVLVDGFITHWHEWLLLGTTIGTAHWGHYTFDTANQFVAAGVQAGILALCSFFMIIACALLGAGRIIKYRPILGWALGLSVVVQCVCFFGISIWGQLHFCWSLPLAMIGSLISPMDVRRTRSVRYDPGRPVNRVPSMS